MIWGTIRAAGKRWGLLTVVAALLMLPLVSVSWWLGAHDRWGPTGELAITEIHVRDVGTSSTPLVGLIGRLGSTHSENLPASHPGPLSFYALAPAYRLLGGSYFALRASTVLLHAVAILLALWVARRRAGDLGTLGTGFALAALELGYGLIPLTEPWNPYLPPFWFATFLLAVWSVACDDVRMLPLLVFAGSFCAQTHIAYVPVCGGLGLLALAVVGASALSARRRGSSSGARARVCLLSVLLAVLLWIPPIIDQAIHEPGNLGMLAEFFLVRPPMPPFGLRAALSLLLTELDFWHLTVNQLREPSTLRMMIHRLQPRPEIGAAVLVLFAIAAAVAIKQKARVLLALHGTVAASLLVAWLAMSRIMGVPWPYLVLWGWTIGAATGLSVAAAAAVAIRPRLAEHWRARTARFGLIAVATIGLFSARLVGETKNAGAAAPNASVQLRELADQTAAALEGLARAGERRPYLLSWSDTFVGMQAFGLLDELDGRGLDVRVGNEMNAYFPARLLIGSNRARARIHLASGAWIGDMQALRGAVQIAYSDPRSERELAEFRTLHTTAVELLRQQGRQDLIPRIRRNLMQVHGQATEPYLGLTVGRMIDIGQPAGVFIVPMH